ncbi:E3 ubiquitin-protein ligase RNF115-like [Amphiura filiformis]|uniref:E3 ubiquitin-protein ligase RNF115-like n=1 Tax=Amphiura filiformis TaxID=82378 RepID=UPI003B219665
MAEAAVDSNNTSVTERFFCHQCTSEISPVLPDYTCPQCEGGFIEQVSSDSDAVEADRDSDGSSSADGVSAEVVDPALAFTTLFSQILGQAAAHQHDPGLMRRPFNLAESSNNSRSSSSGSDSTEGNTSGSTSSSSSTDPNRREPSGPRLHQATRQTRHHFPRMHPRPDRGDPATDMIALLQQLLGMTHAQPLNAPGSGGGMFFPVQMFNLHGNPRDYAWGEGGLDAIITQLLNNVEGQGPPPATKEDLDKLKEVVISNTHTDDNLECPVCKEEYACGDLVKQMPCSHLFHPDCIVTWLEMHNTCPVCRKSVDGESTVRDADIGTSNLPNNDMNEEDNNAQPYH